MTDHHLFDDFVRAKLADHKAPVPGGLWDKIEAATAAEKKRKTGWARIPAAYRAAALLILCAGASALVFWPRPESGSVKPGMTQNETAGVKVGPHHSSAADNLHLSTPEGNNTAPAPDGAVVAGSDNNAIAPGIATENKAGSANTVSVPSSNKPAAGSSAGKRARVATNAAPYAGRPGSAGQIANGNEGINKQNSTIAAAGSRRDNAATGLQRGNAAADLRRDNAATGLRRGNAAADLRRGNAATGLQRGNAAADLQHGNAATGLQRGNAANMHTGGSYNVLNSGSAIEETQAVPTAFNFLPAEMISLKRLSLGSSNSLRQLLDSRSAMMPVIRCPSVRNSIPTDLYLEAYVSPDMPLKQTSANYGGSTYLERKDSSQRLQTSFTAGVRISKGLTENIFLKTGLQYTQINEHFNYRQENERKQVTVITTHTITRPQGDTVLRDTSSYEQIGYLQKRTHNKYKSIDIPVLFSYEWGNDQWRFAANVGAIVNLHSWYAGELLDTSFQAVSIKKDNNEVYKSNIGLGLYAGFSIIKPVAERMDLFAEPYFRYNLSDMTKPGQSFNQRLHNAGLSLGIRYRLNGGQRF
ncbi:outer membrane beta-barrel protein [Filimonas effusa]|uniref:Outer membrane protein beta-barrel domain-containing protein n=1 Tax=Filimonas effusa TaxID=2508721 RepID=A0A4Q1D0Z0_9BACT|nr:outer membrane beta-barrel protein [Filimonas effusa]RXK80586.1 hypothetical protein ESB13_23415 [Filimonas effusa]